MSPDGVWRKQYDTWGPLVINADGSVARTYIPVTNEDIAKTKKVSKAAFEYDGTYLQAPTRVIWEGRKLGRYGSE